MEGQKPAMTAYVGYRSVQGVVLIHGQNVIMWHSMRKFITQSTIGIAQRKQVFQPLHCTLLCRLNQQLLRLRMGSVGELSQSQVLTEGLEHTLKRRSLAT